MPKPISYYPELQRLFESAWKELERRIGRPLTLRDARDLIRARSSGEAISLSSLNGYLRGRQLPEPEQVKKLSLLFYPEDAGKQQAFQNAVKRAGKRRSGSGLIDPFEKLIDGANPIKVGVVDYGPYAWNDGAQRGGFFDSFFRNFVRYAGLRHPENSFKAIRLEDVPRSLCQDGDVDIVLGILATPDRARLMKFFLSPITIHVNAVVRQRDLHRHGEEIANILTNPPIGGAIRRVAIRPIVNRLEVGGLYVVNYLGLPDAEYTDVPYNIQEYARHLKAGSSRSEVPVMIADEFACLRVIAELKGDADLVFRQNGQDASQGTFLLPRYRLGFAVNRDHHKWIEYLTEALPYYLEANPAAIAALYLELRDNLEKRLAVLSDDRAERSKRVAGWLGLHRDIDKEMPFNDPWRRILMRAKK